MREGSKTLDCGSDGDIEVTVDTIPTFSTSTSNVSADNAPSPSSSPRTPLCDRRIVLVVIGLVAIGVAGALAVALTRGDTSRGAASAAANGGGSSSGASSEESDMTEDDFWMSGQVTDEPHSSDGGPVSAPTNQTVLDLLYELNAEANKNNQQQKISLDRPNILFLPVDDLNNWVGYTGKNPQSKTPNFDRLSAMGLSFTNAHAASTVCNPSRAATWSGIRPSTSGCYDNKDEPWTRFIAEGLNLNAHLKNNGWYTAARGKTYHSSKSGFYKADKLKTVYTSEWHDYPKTNEKPEPKPNQVDGFTQEWLNAPNYRDEDDPDWGTAEYCIEQLGKFEERDEPTFLACGLIKPHLPWAVPQKYYDMYPLGEIEVPVAPDDDLDDVPEKGWWMARPDREEKNVTKLGRRANAVQGYLASIRYADMNLGRILDAYEALPQTERDNTIGKSFRLRPDHIFFEIQKILYKK